MKKILHLLLLIFLLLFANTANAIVDDANNSKTEQKQTTKKRFLQRVKTDKTEENSKDVVKLDTKSYTKIQIQEHQELSLEDCIKIAIENSPSVQKYRDLVIVANSLLGQSKASYFPSLNLGTGYYGDYINSSGISSYGGYYGLKTSINQLLFSFGKVGTKIKKAKLNKIAAKYDLDHEIIKTVFNVKTNYYAVLAAVANIKVQKANIYVNERQYQQTKAYFEEGLKSKIDLVNAEVNLSNAKIAYETAVNAYDVAVVALNNSMYIEGSPKYSIAKVESFNFDNKFADVYIRNTSQDIEEFKAPDIEEGAVMQTSIKKNELIDHAYNYAKFPYTLEESIQLAKEHRPDLRSLTAIRDGLKKELTYQKIQYLPNLNAKGGYGLSADHNALNTLSIQGSLDFPAINVMDIKYKIEEAKARLDAANTELDKLSKDIYFNVQKAYVNMIQNEKKIPLTYVSVKQAFENLELALGRYEVGLGNFLEVHDAIENYNKAQENYVKLIFDYNVSRAKLELEIAKVDDTFKQEIENNKKGK